MRIPIPIRIWFLLLQISIVSVIVICLTDNKPVLAANLEFRPSVEIGEEFTDNIFEVPSNKRTEYITRVRPGAALRYLSPFWSWDSTYIFEFRNYARHSKGNEYNHDADIKGNISLVQNFLFLDLSDSYHRVTTDVSRNVATESSLFLNQTDQNTATITPYMIWRLRGDNTLKTGGHYSDVRYWGDGIARCEQAAFIDLNHDVTSKFNLSTGYVFTHLESQVTKYNKHDLSGGFKYEYADKSFVFGQVGNSWQQFSNGTKASYLFWNAGVTHDLGLAMATLATKVQTAADPLSVSTKETNYSGKLEKNLQRGMVGLAVSYSEFVNSETSTGKRWSFNASGSGRYEIMEHLTTTLSVTGEQYSRQAATDYPYRFTAVAGLIFSLKNDLTLGISYNHVTNLNDLGVIKDAKVINKAAIEIKKYF